MRITAYLIVVLSFIFLISCSDENSSSKKEDSINAELKENASKQVEELTGKSSKKIEELSSNNISKKYTVKSGIINFERKDANSKSKIVVYFDDYGSKERNEKYDPEGKIEEIRFSDGSKMYVINYKYSNDKVAYVMGPGAYGTEMKFVAEPFSKESDKQKNGYKKLPNMNVCGKESEVYSTSTSMGEVTFAGWNNILLYSKTKTQFGESVTEALSFQENANVDPDLFKVPNGYEVKNM